MFETFRQDLLFRKAVFLTQEEKHLSQTLKTKKNIKDIWVQRQSNFRNLCKYGLTCNNILPSLTNHHNVLAPYVRTGSSRMERVHFANQMRIRLPAFFRLYRFQLCFVFLYYSIKNSDLDFKYRTYLYFWDRSLKLHDTCVRFGIKCFEKVWRLWTGPRSLIADFQKRRRFVRFYFGYFDEQRGVRPKCRSCPPNACANGNDLFGEGKTTFLTGKKNRACRIAPKWYVARPATCRRWTA